MATVLQTQSDFKRGFWITAAIGSDQHQQVLVAEDGEIGYTLTIGKEHLKPVKLGRNVLLADVVHRAASGENNYSHSGNRVVLKAFTDELDAQEEAAIQLSATRGWEGASKVVDMVDGIRDESTWYIVQEYMPAGDLFNRVSSAPEGFISQPLALSWFSDLLQALIQLKERGIAHMDLSPEVLRVILKSSTLWMHLNHVYSIRWLTFSFSFIFIFAERANRR